MNRDHKQKEVQHNALRLLLQNRPIGDDRKVQQNVRSVAFAGVGAFILQRVRRVNTEGGRRRNVAFHPEIRR